MREGRNKPEPEPEDSQETACWDYLFHKFEGMMKAFPEMSSDIRDRDRYGAEKYGKRLRPFNGRDPEVDLYQELLDAIAYAVQALQEASPENHQDCLDKIIVLVELAENTRKRIGRAAS